MTAGLDQIHALVALFPALHSSIHLQQSLYLLRHNPEPLYFYRSLYTVINSINIQTCIRRADFDTKLPILFSVFDNLNWDILVFIK